MRYLILIILLISSSFSAPLVTTKYKYYDIYPTEFHPIEESMDSSSPLNSFKHGTINWKLKYFYKKQKNGSLCSVLDVKTKLDVFYTVPKLPETHKTSKKVKKAFARYSLLLTEYLNKQRSFSIKAAKEIESELVKISLYDANCELIKSDVKKVANKIIRKYKKKNKNYEIRTYEGFLDSVRSEKL